jgi:GNAT superfamily N-acetyltransferase
MDYTIRKATLDDRDALEQLIAASARGLSIEDYSAQQIETAIATVFGVDTDLIVDGTYFVAESSGRLVGCGGWSKRRTLFGGDRYSSRDSGELEPQTEPARIRAFFVCPEFSRKGIGRALLDRCEAEAAAHGFRALELMATLPGVRLYKTCGYTGGSQVELELADGVKLQLVPMKKVLVALSGSKKGA